MPTSQWSRSPRWIAGSSPSCSSVAPRRCTSTVGWNQVPSPRSFTFWRKYQARSLGRLTPGRTTRSENMVSITAQVSRTKSW